MQSRLAIVLMSVAGTAVLFGIGFLLGLGVMSTPKPEQHKQIALTSQPTKVTKPETTATGGSDDRALTPLTPVAPGGALAQAAQPQAPAQAPKEQAAAKTPPTPAPAPQQQTAAAAATQPTAAPEQKKEEVKPQEAKAEPAPASAPAQTAKADPAPAAHSTPVSLSSRNACDVSACARAYRSFRESDCTYQPFSGPRQVCVSPPGSKDASRGHDTRQATRDDNDEPTARIRVHRPGRDDEYENVPGEVERVTTTDGRRLRDDDDERPALRSYHRDFTADGEDDGIIPADTGRRQFFFEGDDD